MKRNASSQTTTQGSSQFVKLSMAALRCQRQDISSSFNSKTSISPASSAVDHPSQPNYFALYTRSPFGITDDYSSIEPDPTLYTVSKSAGLTSIGYTETQGDGHDFNCDPWVSFPEGAETETGVTL